MVTVEPILFVEGIMDRPLDKKRRFERSFWTGKGSSSLRLRSPVHRSELLSLLKGRSADGKSPLLPNWHEPERIIGWRITAQAPPTAEPVWALAPKGPSNAILKAHLVAMDGCVKELQDWVNHATLGKGMESKGVVAACFLSDFSKQKALGLRSEIILINATPISKKSAVTFSMLGESCETASKALSLIYQQEFLGAIRKRLGLLSVQGKGEPHIFGVPESLKLENGWGKARKSELLESLRLGNRAPYKDEWQHQAQAKGWGVQEVKRLLQIGRKRQFNSTSARYELRSKLREVEEREKQSQETKAESRQGQSQSQSQSKSNSQSQSH